MKYVYLTNNVVTDQAQVDPYNVFNAAYASQFIEAPDEVAFGLLLQLHLSQRLTQFKHKTNSELNPCSKKPTG